MCKIFEFLEYVIEFVLVNDGFGEYYKEKIFCDF